ncbi:MAG: pitrilysin family protein [Pseudomonadota bacterium]
MIIRTLLIILAVNVFSLAYALPDIETWNTKHGIKVMYVQATELPMVDVALTFDAGSVRDGKLPGISVLTHVLLNQGTGDLTADEIASEFESVGAQYSANVDLDRSSISLRSLSKQEWFEKALDLYIKVVSKPEFPERDFARERDRMLIGLEDRLQRPSSIVSEAFYQALYQQHPYSQSSGGTKESLDQITLKDVQKFHTNHLVSKGTILAIVGDVDRKQAEAIADRIGNALPKDGVLNKIPKVKPAPAAKEDIDFPSQQAHVRIGMIGIQRGNPDYFNLYVGNHVLGGGGFTSRLVEEVRGKRGLSYSVYSYFIPYRQPGPFMLGLQTRSDQAEQAIDVCYQVIDDFVQNGPTEEELELSKESIVNGFPLRVDSNRDILGYLSMIGYYDLPITYLNDFSKKIEAVTLEDVKKAFKKHLDVEDLVTIVVGNETLSSNSE